MAKPEWGTKRICPSCGTRYYDMRKDPPTCPSCGTVFDPEALLKSRRARPIPVEEVVKKAPIEREDDDETSGVDTDEEESIEEEADVDTDEDVEVADVEDEEAETVDEDEDVLLEDADELGDDDDIEVNNDLENDDDR
ncbi:TIGR02300 family protein [Indioceanicola profundi]|uniref:TIGR02300 family protein n=1 Tax=Indioceanicola profundi TaxID=2220096 RepID=UPI000E6ACD85|nr:TIGR02300 family protein [Indioceanicola profundi]